MNQLPLFNQDTVYITTQQMTSKIADDPKIFKKFIADCKRRVEGKVSYNCILVAHNDIAAKAAPARVDTSQINYDELRYFIDNLYLMWLEEQFEKFNNAIIDTERKINQLQEN